MEIAIDWSKLKTEDDFYDVFLPQVSAPDWHGRNLDALGDSIVTGSVNGLEPPYVIRSKNNTKIAPELKVFQQKVFAIFQEAINEGRELNVILG